MTFSNLNTRRHFLGRSGLGIGAMALSSLLSRDLNASQDAPLVPVAFLVKAGLPRDVALAALTKNPAKLLGMEASHGWLEPGKLANLLVFDGDPLDPASRLERVFVEGRQVYED